MRHLEKAARNFKAKPGVGCDGFHPKVPLDLTREPRGEVVEFLRKVEQCGRWPQQICTTVFFLIPRSARCANAYNDSLVGSFASARDCEMATKMSN